MCGIFGVVGDGAEAIDPAPAADALHHRGPDARGSYREPGVLLGHTRLAIIDLSEGGAQPMRAEGAALVFNGEIYNHHTLRDDLLRAGQTFRSRSDTEVILKGYLEWGDGVVERLDGMFAFALWDARARRLLLARDRAGKKPLFYSEKAGRLTFASEVKALSGLGAGGGFAKETLPLLLTLGYVPAPLTHVEGVAQLPPAHLAVWEGGRMQTTRYWRSPFLAPRPKAPSIERALHLVRGGVEAAVARRLEADVPLGAFLSGGVDSSIVVAVMSRLLGRRVKTFSIGFSGDERYDETHYARLVAQRYKTEHTQFIASPSSFEWVERLVEMHDGPFGDSSAVPTSIVSMLTKKHVSVALSGDGGDELFAGYTRFYAADFAESVPSPVRELSRLIAARLPEGKSPKRLYARGVRFARRASLPLADRLLAWSAYFVEDLSRVLRPEHRWDLDAPWRFTRDIAGEVPEGESALQTALAHNFAAYLPYDLLVKMDRSSMMHSLEVRSPFLDKDLIAMAAALPDSYRRRGTQTKWILKQAFADLLPRQIMNRAKMGFGVPLGAWFRNELRSYIRDKLAGGARCYEWIERDYVEKLLHEHDAGRADHGQKLWLLLTLEVWLQSRARAA
ncbi:MAG: asparagine synthase (glutamine-hydrolyzing) [Deltaproteobacteria bacterium]|nr:asparagine synthase (glutamine-hydrolyzing) [Deltaproteobacteria bacterium]